MRLSGRTPACALLVLSAALLGCERDPDRAARRLWIDQQTAENKTFLRAILNGTHDVVYDDGWYGLENDPKNKGAWRWMEKRGIVHLRVTEAVDMELHIFGWVPLEHVGFRTCHLEFAVNGHVLDRREPTDSKSFEHVILVPRWLLGSEEWVDLTITAANTARPTGDWRDLGFATTGILWKRGPT